jgi:hypothetical protein
LIISANHLKIFSIKFGASLVFKISSNFAFKNNLEKWKFDLKWILNLHFKICLEFQNVPVGVRAHEGPKPTSEFVLRVP